MLSFVHCAFIICWFTIRAADWEYDDVNEWYKEYPGCGGDTQSPIDVDYNEVDMNCPVTLANGHEALLWNIVDLKRTYNILNNGHALEMEPHDVIYRPDTVNDVINYPVAVLRNNFITNSGEHSHFCLDKVHIHFGSNSDIGSEHTINGLRSPMEMHFVHYSCDYDSFDEALADKNVKDKYVLAVVALLFEVGDHNTYFEHITNQIDYIRQAGDSMLITNADLTDLIPLTTTDFIYYEGSLTTPGCNEVVRWHILGERWQISEEQLEILRELESDHEDHLDNNFRPVQFNKNTVYYCTPAENGKLPGTESGGVFGPVEKNTHVKRTRLYGGVKKGGHVKKGNSMSPMDILSIAFVIAFVCLAIGLFIGDKYMSGKLQQKTVVMDDA